MEDGPEKITQISLTPTGVDTLRKVLSIKMMEMVELAFLNPELADRQATMVAEIEKTLIQLDVHQTNGVLH